jgi:hypothetical protein
VSTVGNDLVTAGIGGASVAVVMLVPGFGWILGGIGFAYIGLRAVKRGLSKR